MNCDKCGKPVEDNDSATQLAVEAGYMETLGLLICADRHIRCSPSRAQFIEHASFAPVVDPRPEYDKNLMDADDRLDMTTRYTNAWLRLRRGDFPLVFNDWLRFRDADAYIAVQSQCDYEVDNRTMVIYFNSAEDRSKMKEHFDLYHWKCNEGTTFIQSLN